MKNKLKRLLICLLAAGISLVGTTTVSQAAAKRPRLNICNLNLTVSSQFRLRVYNLNKKMRVTYTSSDKKIADISVKAKKGKRATVTANSVGACNITVTVKRGKKTVRRLNCKVTVTPSAVCVKFIKKKVRLTVGQSFLLTPVIKPNTSNEQPLFDIDDPEIASVTSRGLLTAVNPGIVKIRATLLSTGQTAVCTVYVREDDSSTTAAPFPAARSQKKAQAVEEDIQ